MDHCLDLFLNYLTVERGLSRNTLEAYGRDLKGYLNFLESEGIASPQEVTPSRILYFLTNLQKKGLSPKSRARALVAMRMFHKFLLAEGLPKRTRQPELKPLRPFNPCRISYLPPRLISF